MSNIIKSNKKVNIIAFKSFAIFFVIRNLSSKLKYPVSYADIVVSFLKVF